MLKYTEGDSTIKGVKIHYYRTGGNKPPLFMLHGASDNGLCWTPVAEILAEKYDVIMPDAQGHGKSDRLDAKFTFESHANQVAGLVDALKLKNPIIMGHSMGAGTTVNVAINYPDLPRAIILEDPAWLVQPGTRPSNPPNDPRQYLSSLSKKTMAELIAECRATNPKWQEAEIEPWAESKMQFDPALFDHIAVNPSSYKEQVTKIKCTTLLIIADGGIVSKATAEDAAKLWKSQQPFKWVYIKGAGHSIRRENFKDYMDAVNSFLKSLPA